jgi:uncharacterized protein (UPF0332 family)
MDKSFLEKLEKQGKLKKQSVGIVQVEALLEQAYLDMQEAEKICHLAERATYLLAYMAMLKAGRALLLMLGYLPDDGAQHKTVVDVTTDFLGEKYKRITMQFETMRRKRNQLTYEAGILLSKTEAQKAFSDAKQIVSQILTEAKSRNPQIKLKF